jgi:PAS domain S-box-containing protein
MTIKRKKPRGNRRDASCEDVILDSIAEGVFTVDSDWRIQSFNRAAEEITGTTHDDAIGRQCWDVFRASICESACALRETMETGERVVGRQVYIINAAGERVPISVSTALLRDEGGEVIGGVETFRDLSVEQELRRELEKRYTFSDMIGRNNRIQELFAMIPDVAESGSTVLIQGESGTGKELLALAIHSLSPRANGPMIVVNCGALPDTLLESELFGHKAGAFTDAKRDKLGRFALAEGGTVFLDEIGDISTALQSKLLRVLQDGTYEPLGGTETLTADVRIVSASNRDLPELVERGDFRRDLFYRINVVTVELPPLRERKDDIPLLVDHFIARFNRLRNRDVSGVSSAVMSMLMGHDFPGNIRELENIIEHAFVTCRAGQIGTRHLPAYLKSRVVSAETGRPYSMQDVERQFLVSALERNNGNRLATARELGIHKTTLWRRMKRLGLL